MLNAGFATLDYLKSRLLPHTLQDEFQWDETIAKLGLGVAGRFNAFCNRVFQRVEDQTDEFSASNIAVILRAYPVEEITSVQLRAFTGTLDDFTSGYQIDQRAGLIQFRSTPGAIDERIVITYTGGHWLDDGLPQPAGTTRLPDDILEAYVLQCQAWAEARRMFGEISMQSQESRSERPSSLTLDTEVAAILTPHRRFSGS